MSWMGAAQAGASFIGSAMQMIAAQQAQREMAEAFEREMAEQQGFRRQGFETFQPAVRGAGLDQALRDMSTGEATRMGSYNRLASVPMDLGRSFNAPTATRDLAYGNLLGQSRAKLGSYSDWALQQLLRSNATQNTLNRLSSFAGGLAQTYPYEMYQAQHAGDQLAMIGALIQSIGGSGDMSRFFQGPKPWGSPGPGFPGQMGQSDYTQGLFDAFNR